MKTLSPLVRIVRLVRSGLTRFGVPLAVLTPLAAFQRLTPGPALQVNAPEAQDPAGALESLIEDLGTADPEPRRRALVRLAELGDAAASALGPVLERLDDPSLEVRRAAATTAGAIGGDPERVMRAIALCLDDPDWKVRQNAIRSAHGLGESALDGVVRWLPDPALGPGALEILCTSRPRKLERAEAALVQPHLVPKAIDLLQVAGSKGFAGLSHALENDVARPYALRALRRIGAARPATELGLAEILRESRTNDPRQLLLASVALSGGAPYGVPSDRLIALAADEEACVRELAQWSFGRRGPGGASYTTTMRKGLVDEDPGVRRTAAWSLGMLVARDREWRTEDIPGAGSDVGRHGGLGLEPGPQVIQRASRGSARLRRWRGQAIEWSSNVRPARPGGAPPAALREAVPDLVRVARSGDAATTRVALWSLGQAGLGAAVAREDLLALVGDSGRGLEERRQALVVLARSGAWPEGVVAFSRMARSEDPELRRLGIEGLGWIGARSATGVIAESLGVEQVAEDAETLEVALEALARLAPLPGELLEELEALYRAGHRRVAGLLVGFGAPAVGVLSEGLESTDAATRAISIMTLERLGRRARPTLPALRKLLDDPDADVRTAAKQAVRLVAPSRKKNKNRVGPPRAPEKKDE